MLKLSTKGRYGVRLMLNLAHHLADGEESVILRTISKEEDISIRYLEQIIIPLKIKKLVKSTRGAGGGYALNQDPAKIKLLEIIEILEGDISIVDCVEDEDCCERRPDCLTYPLWKKASKLLRDYFPTAVFTGKCLVFVSEEWRVELTEHKDSDFSKDCTQASVIRVRIFKKALNGELVPGHYEDFQLESTGELAEQIEKYVQLAVGTNIREALD